MNSSGSNVDRLHTRTRIQKLSKFFSVTPRPMVIPAPNWVPITPPRLEIDIIRAYMVASIPTGQSLAAKTRMGIVLIQPKIERIALSPTQKAPGFSHTKVSICVCVYYVRICIIYVHACTYIRVIVY